jgi:hypothetical protein
LKPPAGAARTEVVAAELLCQLLVAMHELLAALDLGLGGETFAALACDFKSGRTLEVFFFAWPVSFG